MTRAGPGQAGLHVATEKGRFTGATSGPRILSDPVAGLPGASPGAVSTVVAPVLLKYRVCRPRLLLAGSRAEVDPAADVGLLHGEVLLIEDSARQYDPIGDTDRKYRATEKLLQAEEEYHEALCSAKELYARPLARNYPEFHDVIFQPLADLAAVTYEHCQRVSDLFPGSFWNSYWEYLESYGEARRILDELRASEDPLLHFLGLRQAAARHSPSSLLLLPKASCLQFPFGGMDLTFWFSNEVQTPLDYRPELGSAPGQ
ncbi:hypothetical protein WN55_00855 [Dufourea novaeangliae]|uniref:DH domain-containing protein n=1 Tax=Dufourea novaeangliae TaxID=178035 RepID=A0A154PER7_DUFNO|nr:hypothetical protein WN55_00855 [Dufourea novaeangliae]